MRMKLLGATVLQSAAFTSAVMLAQPAFAQDVPPADQDAAAAEQPAPTAAANQSVDCATNPSDPNCAAIVVTGSRIKRPNLESTVPITSVQGDAFFETGQTSVGDTLNELPALRNTFNQSNSTRFLGTSGLNILDLRGLGTQRTLTLVNGRRHIASNILGNAVEVDTNTIPTDLIERVDVVTGGNSAIYGSDAIAGVVNFVLKQDYEGLQVRGQGGISKYGDAGSYYISALGGTNFADGRGNVALNFEYARQDDFYASQRGKCFRNVCGFFQVEEDPVGESSDGTPDRRFFEDVRFVYYANGGTVWSGPYFGYFTYLEGTNNRQPGLFVNPYIFQPDGTLAPQTGERIGVPYFGYFLGGNGDNARDGKQFGLSPALDRYAFNLIGHYEVSPALVPFVEAKWVRTDSLGNASGPFFTPSTSEVYPDGHPLGDDPSTPNVNEAFSRDVFFTDNPFLNPQARDVLEGHGQSYFYMYRNYLDLGNREEKARRDTFQIVTGVRGDFNDDWSYEVSLNYGKLKEKTRIFGNVNTQRFLLAKDAVDDGTGNIVCRAKIDPDYAIPLANNLDPAFAAAQLANDVANCVPLNPFGSGNISQAAKDYILQDSLAKGWIKQFVVNAFVSGDTSEFINLPGGPIGFALGAEHRNYDVSYKQDDATAAGMTFYNAIPDFTPPTFKVNEVFGEIRLPILKDQIIHELTLSGAARYAKYKTFGGVWAYNIGGELAPTRDIRFRGNFSRAVRAPSLADAFTPLGSNFTPAPEDPCALDNRAQGSEFREANCLAAGVPADFNFEYTRSLAYLSGGNADLKPESSDSITLGGVLTPRWVPGFSLSVDYYNITVHDVITSPSAQAVINACYDLPDLDNPFCPLFERAGPGGGPGGEEEGRIIENSLHLIPLNYAKLKVRGLDFEAAYRGRLFDIGMLDTRVIWTHVLQNDQFLDPTDPGIADQILLELNDPKDEFSWNTTLKTGKFSFGYQLRYIGKQLLNGTEYETWFSKQGRPAQDPDFADQKFYPTMWYHDVRAAIDVSNNYNFYVGIDDITNEKPPLGATGIGGGTGVFRNIGRFFYAGFKARF